MGPKFTPSVERSTTYADSFAALSTQASSTREALTTVAASAVGAAGIAIRIAAAVAKAELPAPFVARTRKVYVVPCTRPMLVKFWASTAAVPAAVKVVPLVDRSIWKPLSLFALSVHARSMAVAEATVASGRLGAGGAAVRVAATFEYAETPAPFVARTRYQYEVPAVRPPS